MKQMPLFAFMLHEPDKHVPKCMVFDHRDNLLSDAVSREPRSSASTKEHISFFVELMLEMGDDCVDWYRER
jgi:hypothetical protein